MEKVFYIATYEDTDFGKLYFGKDGIWREFSVGATLLANNIEALNYHYEKWNRCNISQDVEVRIEKVKVTVEFEKTV